MATSVYHVWVHQLLFNNGAKCFPTAQCSIALIPLAVLLLITSLTVDLNPLRSWIFGKMRWTLWNFVYKKKLYAIRMSSRTPQSLFVGHRLKSLCLMKELAGVKMKLKKRTYNIAPLFIWELETWTQASVTLICELPLATGSHGCWTLSAHLIHLESF